MVICPEISCFSMVQLGSSRMALPLNTSTCRRSRLLPHEPQHACSLWRRCGRRSLCVTKWRRVCGNQARRVTPVGGRQLAMHKTKYRRWEHWRFSSVERCGGRMRKDFQKLFSRCRWAKRYRCNFSLCWLFLLCATVSQTRALDRHNAQPANFCPESSMPWSPHQR